MTCTGLNLLSLEQLQQVLKNTPWISNLHIMVFLYVFVLGTNKTKKLFLMFFFFFFLKAQNAFVSKLTDSTKRSNTFLFQVQSSSPNGHPVSLSAAAAHNPWVSLQPGGGGDPWSTTMGGIHHTHHHHPHQAATVDIKPPDMHR